MKVKKYKNVFLNTAYCWITRQIPINPKIYIIFLNFADPKLSTSVSALFSDANLVLLSNKNNAIVQVLFRNLYPVSLSGLQYAQDATDVQYLTATFMNMKIIMKFL